jgi:hypothetical protein
MRRDGPARGTGRGVPPIGTRFAKGRSGNPRGRPRGSRRQAPHEAVLGQKVTVREEGLVRQMTAAEAFLLHVTQRGLEGDSAAARAAMAAIAQARARRGSSDADSIPHIVIVPVAPGCVNQAMRGLRMAVKQDAFRPTARIVLEPWIVEAALDRLGARRLDTKQQRTVWKATRTPWKVRWPQWWSYREEGRSAETGEL